MNAIEMYDVLKNIPQVSDEQARDMADSLVNATNVATKGDLINMEAKLKEEMAKLEARIFKQLIVGVGIIIAAMVGLKIFS